MASEAPTSDVPVTGEEDVGGRARVGYVLRHSKGWLIALILLAVAVAVAAASFALFTSSSANPDNSFSAGILTQSNSKDNAAILSASKLVPGQTQTGTVTITNTGDVSGDFKLSDQDLKNFTKGGTETTTGALLSDQLVLTIRDDTTNNQLYSGPIKSLGTVAIPGTDGPEPWSKDESHDFTFSVKFQATGSDATDNTYQGTKTTVQYNWDATSK